MRHTRNNLSASRVMLQSVQQGHIADVHRLCHPSLFVVFLSAQESIHIRGPRCQSSRCNCSCNVFFQGTCPNTLFSFSSLSFLSEQESDRFLNLCCQSSRREVCQSIRFRSLCQSPLDVSYRSTCLSSLCP